MEKVFLKAFLIHRRPFQENGLLLDFFTLEHGMLRCVNKYSRKSRRHMPSFILLNILVTGKSELKSLREWEVNKHLNQLNSEEQILGLYINELLYRLAQPFEVLTNVFNNYQQFIETLPNSSTNNKHWALRIFENILLEELGYGLDYEIDSNNNKIDKNKNYNYQDNIGFVADIEGMFSGAMLFYLQKNSMTNIPNEIYLKQSRNLARTRLLFLLGDKPLKTRELFK